MEDYIAQMLIMGFSGSNRQDVAELTEGQLLQRVQLNIHPRELEKYNRLVELRRQETLTEEEYARLLALTNRIEIAYAERMKYVVALAKLRGVTLEQMMLDLGIQKNAA